MIDLSTKYMGLDLKNPFIVGSSRLTDDLKNIRQCIEAGASAIVLKSLFEEQIKLEAESHVRTARGGDVYYWFPEAEDRVVGELATVDRHVGSKLVDRTASVRQVSVEPAVCDRDSRVLKRDQTAANPGVPRA